MAAAGVHLIHSNRNLAVMGVSDVITRLPAIVRIYQSAFTHIVRNSTCAVILIDSPDFNLRLARRIARWKQRQRKLAPKVFYYVTPQVWIWRKRRIHDIGRYCDAVIPVFDFEHDLFRRHGIPSFFAGHPINDIPRATQYDQKVTENQVVLALLPGSRLHEVRRILPVMLASVARLSRDIGPCRVVVSRSGAIDESVYEHIARPFSALHIGWQSDLSVILATADLVLAKSGTNNLQIALIGTPALIVYRTSFLTWMIARWFLRLRHISLLNLLSEREIVPEFVQYRARPRWIAAAARRLLTDEDARTRMTIGMADVASRIKADNVSSRVAEFLVNHL